jgi:tight adherence protein C
MEIVIIAIGVFGIVAASVFFLLVPKAQIQGEAIRRRLEAITTRQAQARPPVRLLRTEEPTLWEHIAAFFLGEKELPGKYTAVRRLLHQAGYPAERAVRIYWGVRIFCAGIFAAGFFFLAALLRSAVSEMLILIGAGGCAGYLLPYFHVLRRAKSRVRQIQEVLPDTLDLLVVCVEAGLGLDAALNRVGKEQAEQELAIGVELQLMSQEVQAGISRREALFRMQERVGLDDLRGLVTFLVQTEELGGSIARSLRVYSDTMRNKRILRAEEAARKAVIKLIFPLVLFILPALFLVILGPAVINLIKFFARPF